MPLIISHIDKYREGLKNRNVFEFEINNSGKYSDKTEVKPDILIVRIINFDKAEQIDLRVLVSCLQSF